MFSDRTINTVIAFAGTVLLLLLGACASNADNVAASEGKAASPPKIRCPTGYTMVCEAKKVGRIRFGRIGKDNLDSCACEPEYGSSGRPARPIIPSADPR